MGIVGPNTLPPPAKVTTEKTASPPLAPLFFVFMTLGVFFLTLGFLAGTIPFLALGGTLVGGCISKGLEEILAKPKAKALEAKTVFDCQNYESVTLELKLADAGIMKREEITTCEDTECPLCAPIAQHKRDLSAQAAEWKMPPRRSLSQRVVRESRIKLKSPTSYRRSCKYCGVPAKLGFTVCDWCYDKAKLQAKKEYTNHGPEYVRQKRGDYTEIMVDQMKKPIATYGSDHKPLRNMAVIQRTWTPVYDPDTGEHLGDFRIKADGSTETRNAPWRRSVDPIGYDTPRRRGTTSTGPR